MSSNGVVSLTPSRKYLHNVNGKREPKPSESMDGMMLPPGVRVQNIRNLQENMTARPDDVFVVTFPKSGTTWMQQIVKLIRNNGEEDGSDIDVVLPWIDVMTLDEVEVTYSYLKLYLCVSG